MTLRSRRLVWIPSLMLAAAVVAPGCANMPWLNNTAKPTAAASPGEDDREPPPTPFEPEEKIRIAQVHPYVAAASQTYEIDPNLIHGMIWVESRHIPRAKSPAGARGLMQLMPATANAMARQLGRSGARPYDPEFNVTAGTFFLSRLLEKYEGDETLALAAYNAGPGNVDKWIAGDGLPAHSLQYVALVQDARRRFEALNGQWSLPLDDAPTMIASAEQPARAAAPAEEPHVPEPPVAVQSPRPAPKENPWAPSPDVYKPTPPPEPPLVDTPYPPEDEAEQRRARTPASSPPERAPARRTGLPSVLD